MTGVILVVTLGSETCKFCDLRAFSRKFLETASFAKIYAREIFQTHPFAKVFSSNDDTDPQLAAFSLAVDEHVIGYCRDEIENDSDNDDWED